MGMFRDTANQDFDIVKEMAESLGSTGLKLEDLLERTCEAHTRAQELIARYNSWTSDPDRPSAALVNESIKEYNSFVDKAQDARTWLLIQREACGFRIHRNVDDHYPIPRKIRPLDP
ncbi:MAG: hypothetical protein FJY85_16120 [Deltaproteobacteria bacterium]|nr:hypothetical protein [Deltaproteobacteria bacterium]